MNDHTNILSRIHPDFGPLLEAMAGAAPFHELSVPEAREAYRKLQAPAPQIAVGSVRDGSVPGPAGPIKIRIYAPAGEGPHPGILHFHGGGFVIGDLETHDAQCRTLCQCANAVVIAVDYRLAPEHKLPAAHEDAVAAMQHLFANAAEFGVDPARIGVTGDSAGGNLTAVCGLVAKMQGLPLKAQMPVVPGIDRMSDNPERRAVWAKRNNPVLSLDTVDFFSSHSMPEGGLQDDPRLPPLLEADLSGLAPAIVVVAEIDILHDEGVEYAERLRGAGVKVELIDADGMIHPFFSMPHMIPAAKRVVEKASTLFGEWLRA